MRHAILLFGNPSRSGRSLRGRRGMEELIGDVETWLSPETLGDDGYATHVIADSTAIEAYTQLNGHLDGITGNDELLFYYYGHGLRPTGRLHFFVKGSRHDQRNSMLPFRQVIEQISGAGPRACFFILDCCYSGAATLDLSFEEIPAEQYYLMASAVARARATAHGIDESTMIGAFTKELMYATTSRSALDDRRVVSFASLFNHASQGLRSQFEFQEPTSAGQLGAEAFWSRPNVMPDVQGEPVEGLRRTSYYRKILRLVEYLERSEYDSPRELYRHALSLEHEEFLVKQESPEEDAEFVQFGTFEKYISLLRVLGVVPSRGPLALAERGSRLPDSGYSEYNSGLFAMALEALANRGIDLPQIERDIIAIFDAGGIPDIESLYERCRHRIHHTTKWEFRVLVDLLAVSGGLQWSSRRTYYPTP